MTGKVVIARTLETVVPNYDEVSDVAGETVKVVITFLICIPRPKPLVFPEDQDCQQIATIVLITGREGQDFATLDAHRVVEVEATITEKEILVVLGADHRAVLAEEQTNFSLEVRRVGKRDAGVSILARLPQKEEPVLAKAFVRDNKTGVSSVAD